MSNDKWFYAQNGQKSGPVAGAALKQMAMSGQLSVSDLVWREGMPEWAPASKVKGLFPEGLLASSPPPLPASPAMVADAPEANLDQRYNSIYCSSDERIVFGLAGGLAHKYGLPVGVVRVLVVVSMFFAIGFAYFAGIFLPKLPTKGIIRPAA
jgi:phage shock protein PspC (stress-responsive transcriptional regulator)